MMKQDQEGKVTAELTINEFLSISVPSALASSQKVTCWEADLMSMTGRRFRTSM